MTFVWSRVQLFRARTIQIIRSHSLISSELSSEGTSMPTTPQVDSNPFVASKRGKYYYPSNCTKAKTLSISNMLYFKDKIGAEAAGFKAHLGCK